MDRPASAPAVVLASASPRRRELIGLLGLPVAIDAAEIAEALPPGAEPHRLAVALAEAKARAIAAGRPDAAVIGADTIVVLDGGLLGKPADRIEALAMLRRLRGRTHLVVTGLAVVHPSGVHPDGVERGSVAATVTIRLATDAELQEYVAGGEPLDKAGAYALQGWGGTLVERVDGCWLNVVGLPVCRLARLLQAAGVAIPVDVPAACAARTGRPCAPGCC